MTRLPDDATLRQITAADPAASTWLSANAGSGKTRVLTDRVARMLLSGVDPGQILCLTYTKAAASEMQNRLFARLGEWAMKEDASLRAALSDLGVTDALSGDALIRARRLFARAIETPGGLRIQTIHSFCASLLRRFPLEAGVSPLFTEMDERSAKLLRDEILDDLAGGTAPAAMEALARAYRGEELGKLADEVAARRNDFTDFMDEDGCRALFGVPEGETADSILADVFLGGEAEWLPQVALAMAAGSVTDQKSAARLSGLDFARPDLELLTALEGEFLSGAKTKEPFTAKTGKYPTKATQSALGPLMDRLNPLMARVEAARARRVALSAAVRAMVLHGFAAVFLPEYARRKADRGWLDFDDLITRARHLLTDRAVAQWVLYRLDGGVDHILVDEAQDTSPEQWQVIEHLAAEFTAGEGARALSRTIFVVGDKKQSIYSFQGADVAAFDEKRDLFAGRLSAIDRPLQDLQLEYSFRSSPTILRLVDATFDADRQAALGGAMHHIAFRAAMPGRVDLWPPFEPAEKEEDRDWFDPVDLIGAEHHATRLAARVAETIRDLIAQGHPVPDGRGMRACHAGDFLILVRRRSDVFGAIIAASKAAGLPTAGADRLKLGAELAVKDIRALLAFLDTPEDDLSLAAALRSPLLGWSERDLYALAQGREGFLWERLRHRDDVAATLAILTDLRDNSDYLRPYDLIERLLTRHDGRRRLLARLGAEAEDGIDELLSQALAYERAEVPSLTGFLCWLDTDDVEVKRQMDSAGGKIRVMTVHGAKGLEAPIVILPDTAPRQHRERGELAVLPGGPVWKMPADQSPTDLTAHRQAQKEAETAESMRLLYVAMTRAQSWLIVAAAGRMKSPDAEGGTPVWYDLIRDALARIGGQAGADGGLSLAEGDWTGGEVAAAPPAAAPQVTALPDWTARPAPEAPRPPPMLKPSELGGAKALPGDFGPAEENEALREALMERGTRLHLLLEHLPAAPEADWPLLAGRLLPGAGDRDALLDEAAAVLRAPHLAHLFAPGTLAEVPFVTDIAGRPMTGVIDRLVIAPDHVLAVDFKSNHLIPARAQDVPEGLLRQMGAYADALRRIWPDRRVEVALLWTRSAELMVLPPDLVTGAVARVAFP
ncbi:double-strand break repair helicase AddA [Szabonella alba]|uniref:DNA 3'-5' helicase n=1 Tax=Szabonella alba TaxID=2804194 RepID=A0A8K0Y1Z4_9RHOB|nr:double-strand break repair helicase AddA [Szabonella alba]MBL4916609.1 double-strand break repair helicase AddA [Szabonella alba]